MDAVLRGLARLAAEDDGDDHDAAQAAGSDRGGPVVAPHLGRYRPVVAPNLWIGVRTFRWRSRHGSVAANIARDLRSVVLTDLGLDAGARHHLAVVPTDPTTLELVPDAHDPQQRSASRERVRVGYRSRKATLAHPAAFSARWVQGRRSQY